MSCSDDIIAKDAGIIGDLHGRGIRISGVIGNKDVQAHVERDWRTVEHAFIESYAADRADIILRRRKIRQQLRSVWCEVRRRVRPLRRIERTE